MKKLNAPCKTCERKGCGSYHSECEAYQLYLKANEKDKERRFKEYTLDSHYQFGQFKRTNRKYSKCHLK